MQNRIGFIDALRGFTMLLVVFGHVLSNSFGRIELPFAQFFLTFRMPLFFFISGFIGYKAVEFWDSQFYLARLKKKSFVQTIPATIFILVSFVWFNSNIYDFFCVHAWEGFWFTFCLFEMFLIYYTLSLFAKKLKFKSCLPVMILLSVLGVGYLAIGNRGGIFYNVFIIESLTKYFQFFTTGLVVRKYWDKVAVILSNERTFNTLFLLFVVLFIVMNIDGLPPLLYKLIHDILIRYVGAAVVFCIFFIERDKLNSSEQCKMLKFIGRRTLDIYLIHNFFVPNLSFINPIIEKGNQIILELTISIVVTLLIVAASLAVSWIIRRSDTLAWYCFGVSRSK